jgi:negative regulator of replication initiation
MRTIRISDEVWQAVADQGKFGETEDDVLRRIFKLPASSIRTGDQTNLAAGARLPNRAPSGRRRSFAAQRMSSFINKNELHVEFHDGASSSWSLPARNDKAGIRALLDNAIEFARKNKASLGQINAVRKTLTSADYHITK